MYLTQEKGKDYMPLWKVEDILSDNWELLIMLAENLIELDEKHALAIARWNDLFSDLKPDIQQQLSGIELSDEDMNIDQPVDKFGPMTPGTMKLPESCKVTLVENE